MPLVMPLWDGPTSFRFRDRVQQKSGIDLYHSMRTLAGPRDGFGPSSSKKSRQSDARSRTAWEDLQTVTSWLDTKIDQPVACISADTVADNAKGVALVGRKAFADARDFRSAEPLAVITPPLSEAEAVAPFPILERTRITKVRFLVKLEISK